jgi:endonuclease YncB( thermonuclease family)
MATRKPKSFKALLLTSVVSILAGLGYLITHLPYSRVKAPGVRAVTGRVVGVSDGDTITVLAAGNQQL